MVRHGSSTPARPELRALRLTPLTRAIQMALLPGLALGLPPLTALAAPTGGEVQAGAATITQSPSASLTTIQQATQRAAIDWQSFDVARHETVQFNQPNARASVLNRIGGQSPSQIFGQVKANGQVVLMNPNGVFFKPGAQVNVGSLIAGAMRIGVDDFMRGNYRLDALRGSEGRVVNEGRIEAAAGGDVTLVGQSVANTGVIVATAGKVNLVAGEQVTVDFDGDGLLRFAVDKAVVENAQALDDQVANSGQIMAEGGEVLITASAAENVFKNAINNQGLIKAGRIQSTGGKVMLVGMGPGASVLNTGQVDVSAASAADAGGSIGVQATHVVNSGTLRADGGAGDGGTVRLSAEQRNEQGAGAQVSAQSAAAKGGRVEVTGETVALNYNAEIDVSGATGGGEALVGGDYRGENSAVRNAQTTFVSRSARIAADANEDGDGGKVVVWANDTTRFHGAITARGGANSGNGGFVEVSGKESLSFRGSANTTAAHGQTGTLLLDPATLTITAAASGGEEASFLPTIDFDDDNAGGLNTVSWGAIDALVAATQIVLEASGLVTVNDVNVNIANVTTAGGVVLLDLTTGSLTLRSTGGNVVFANQGNVIRTEGGTINILAPFGTVTAGGFSTIGNAGNTAGNVNIVSATGGSIASVVTDNGGAGTGTLTLTVNAGTMTQFTGSSFSGSDTIVTKAGGGTLVLARANTHGGATTVSAGTLEVANAGGLGTVAAGTIVSDGAALVIDNVNIGAEILNIRGTGVSSGGALIGRGTAAQSQQIGLSANATITVETGGTLSLNTGANGGIDDGGGSFDLTKIGTGTLSLLGANTFDGSMTVSAGKLILGNATSLGPVTGGIAVANGAALEINNVAIGAEALSIQGTGISNGGALIGTGAGASFAGAVTLLGTTAVEVGSGAQLSMSGIINDGGNGFGLTKTGGGVLTLGGANSYSGATTVNGVGGTLRLGAANVISNASALVITAGSFDVNGNNDTVASLEGAGGTVTNSGAAATLTFGDGNDKTYSGSLTGTLALSKQGAGRQIFNGGGSSYTGAVAVTAGTLEAANASALGTSAGGVTVSDGAALAINGVAIGAEAVSLQGTGVGSGGALVGLGTGASLSGAITLDAATQITVGSGADLTLSGAIDEAGVTAFDLTKTGVGRLVLSGANAAFDGAMTVSAGTLALGNATALGTVTGTTTVASGATLEVNAAIALAEGLTIEGTGVGTNGALTSATTGSFAGAVTLAGTTTVGGAGALTVSGAVDDGLGTFGLSKVGTGSVRLSGANAYDGTVDINAGTLIAANATALGDIAGGVTVADGATLVVDNATIGAEALTITGNGFTSAGALQGVNAAVYGGGITLTGTTAIGGPGTLTLNGIITDGLGTFGISLISGGTVELGAANDYDGATTVNGSGGTLRLGAAGSIKDSSALIITAGTFDVNGNNDTVASLEGAGGTVTNSGAAATLTFGDGNDKTYSGSLTGTLALSKQGAGRQIFNGGGSSYTGAVAVAAGTLEAANASALGTSAGGVTVSDGAALAINGVAIGAEAVSLQGTGVGSGGALVGLGTGASLSGAITLDAATQITVGSGADLTLSGAIDEAGVTAFDLTKTGVGRLVLSGANAAFDGAMTVSAGTLALGNATALGTVTGATTVASGATLEVNAAIALAEGLTIEGTGVGTNGALTSATTGSFAGAVTLAGTTTVGGAGTLTLNGALTDGGGVFGLGKVGDGTVILSVANTYDGTTTVSNGVLRVSDAAGLGAAGGGLGVDGTTVTSGGTLELAFNGTTAEQLSLTGTGEGGTNGALRGTNTTGSTVTGTVDLAGAGATIDVSPLAGLLTLNGVVSGSALTKTGPGTLVLNGPGANTYAGTTTVSAGRVRVEKAAGLGAATPGVANVGVNGTSVAAGAVLELAIAGGASLSEALSIVGVNLTTGSLVQSTASTTTLTGGISLAGNATVDVALGTLEVATNPITGAFTLTKIGNGTLFLNVAGSTASLDIDAGTFSAGAGALNDTTNLDILTGTTFNLNGVNHTIATLSGGGTVTNDVTGASNNTAILTIGGSGTATFTGTLTDSAAAGQDDRLALSRIGTGTQIFSSAVTGDFSGSVSVTGGTFLARSLGSFGNAASATDVSANGTLELDLTGSVTELLTLASGGAAPALLYSNAGTATIDSNVTLAGDANISVSNVAGVLTIGAGIAESGGARALTKLGAGRLNLSIGNAYTGATNVNAGTLAIGALNVLNPLSTLNVLSGAIFDLNGNSQEIAVISGAGTITNQGGAASTLVVSGTGAMTFDGILSDGAAVLNLEKTAGGDLRLNGDSSYDGTTTVTAGEITVGHIRALGSTVGQTIVNAPGQLDIAVGGAINEALELAGMLVHSAVGLTTLNGGITLNAESTIDVSNSGTLSVATLGIGGPHTLNKIGGGVLQFAVAGNTYSGLTRINAGTLLTTATNALINSSGIDLNATGKLDLGGTNQQVTNIDSESTTEITNSVVGVATLSVTGSGTVAGRLTDGVANGADLALSKAGVGGTLELANASNTFSGATQLAGSGVLRAAAGVNNVIQSSSGLSLLGTAEFQLNGTSQQVGTLNGVSTARVEGSGTLVVNGAGTYAGLLGGGLNLVKSGSGVFALSNGGNNFSGTASVTGGTLRTDDVNVLSGSVSLTVSGAGIFALNGQDQSISMLLGNGTITNANAAGATLTVNSLLAGPSNFTGSMQDGAGGGALNLQKLGAGVLQLGGNNTYSGNTFVSAGTLQAATSNTAFSANSDFTINGPATLDVNDLSVTVDSLSAIVGTLDLGAGSLAARNDISLTGVSAVTFAGSGNQSIVAGTLPNAAATLVLPGLTKSANGNLTLTAPAGVTIVGSVQVDNGNLTITNDYTVSGDLVAQRGNVTLTGGTGVMNGGVTQRIDAGSITTGTLALGAVTKNGGGGLTLGGTTAITAAGTVLAATGDLVIEDNLTSSVGGTALQSSGNIIFQGSGASVFSAAALQTVDASGSITTPNGATLTKVGANDLALTAGTSIGAGAGSPVRVAISGGGGLRASAANDIAVSSAGALRVNRLETGAAANTVDVRTTTSGALTMTGTAGYVLLTTDSMTLGSAGDVVFDSTALTVASLDILFGQSTAGTVDFNVAVVAPLFDILGGASSDTIDTSTLVGDLIFTITNANEGAISGAGLTVDTFTSVENIIARTGGSDELVNSSGLDANFVLTGSQQGTVGNLLGGGWQGIDILRGRTGGSDSVGVGPLVASPTQFVLTGLNQGTATNAGLSASWIWTAIENISGTSNVGVTGDSLAGGDEYTISGANIGITPDVNLAGNRITGVWSSIDVLIGTGGNDTVNIENTGSLSGTITGAGGSDTLTYAGRNDSAVFVTLTTGANSAAASFVNGGAAGGVLGFSTFVGGSSGSDDTFTARNETTNWTINGGPDETLADVTGSATFSGFEFLHGGSAVDTFFVTASTSFVEIHGNGDADVFHLRNNAILTANLFGETGNDTVFFGIQNTASNSSILVGSINLGADIDTLDISGTAITLAGDLISGTFAGVNSLVGNGGSQINGQDANTFWLIDGQNTGLFASTIADLSTPAAQRFLNFSILGGSLADTFFFAPGGVITGTNGNDAQIVTVTSIVSGEQTGTIRAGDAVAGIDGGDGIDVLVGSPGNDTFDFDVSIITGEATVEITVGANTTALTDIENIDSSSALSGGGILADTGADIFNLGSVTWGGFIKGGGGSDTLNVDGGVTATISAITGLGMTSAVNSFTGTDGFSEIEVLNTGGGNDTITLTGVAPTANNGLVTLNLGGGPADSLNASYAVEWLLTTNGAGLLRAPGSTTTSVAFAGVENLASSVSAVLRLPTTAPGASIEGTFSAPTMQLAAGNANAGANGLRLAGLNGAPVAVTSAGSLNLQSAGEISIAGSLATTDLTLNSGAAIGITGGVTAANASLTAATGISIGGNLTAANSTLSAGGTISVVGDLTSGSVSLAANGGIAVGGSVNATGNFTSSAGGSASFNAVTTSGNQSYAGSTTFRGNLSGANLVFNGVTSISGNVAMTSSTNLFDFLAPVTSGSSDVLSIVPIASNGRGVDIVINTTGAGTVGHIASNMFVGFNGTLAIGGLFTPNPLTPGDILSGEISSATADHISVEENLLTSGNLLLIGSALEFASGIEVAAGAAGEGTIAVLSLGNSILANNDGATDGAALGNIEGPLSGETKFTGGRTLLAATGELLNAGNLIMNMRGGEVLVAQGAAAANQQVNFSVLSNASTDNQNNATDTELLISVAQLAGFTNNAAALFQNARVFFPNPAAILTILQAVSFVDASLFEEDLSLFGVIGNGIALSLDQCEDAEGCAPSVTEEELKALIDKLNERISRLEGLVQSGQMPGSEAEPLLAGYRKELQNFLAYQQDLAAYNARQESDEFGDDSGDEFEDVFEAEEALEPADAGAAPAAEQPEALPEFDEAEEPFAPIDEPAENAAPADEPAPAEEDFEELDEAVEPAVDEPAAAPAPAPAPEDNSEPNFDEGDDEFEELEEELEPEMDQLMLNELLQPGNVNQLAGAVRVDGHGGVVWAGDVVLPSLHRRY